MFLSYDQLDVSVSYTSDRKISKEEIEAIRVALEKAEGATFTLSKGESTAEQGYLVFKSEIGATEADDHFEHATAIRRAVMTAAKGDVRNVNVTYVDAIVQVGFDMT